MSFDDKRPLLHWLFDGKDDQGRNYGIYITKRGRGPRKKIDDFLCSRITGIRALKSGDTDYQSLGRGRPRV